MRSDGGNSNSYLEAKKISCTPQYPYLGTRHCSLDLGTKLTQLPKFVWGLLGACQGFEASGLQGLKCLEMPTGLVVLQCNSTAIRLLWFRHLLRCEPGSHLHSLQLCFLSPVSSIVLAALVDIVLCYSWSAIYVDGNHGESSKAIERCNYLSTKSKGGRKS